MFNVWKRFSRDQELFAGDLQAWITLARNIGLGLDNDHFEAEKLHLDLILITQF